MDGAGALAGRPGGLGLDDQLLQRWLDRAGIADVAVVSAEPQTLDEDTQYTLVRLATRHDANGPLDDGALKALTARIAQHLGWTPLSGYLVGPYEGELVFAVEGDGTEGTRGA